MSELLKPCPFCGLAPTISSVSAIDTMPYSVKCLNAVCGMNLETYHYAAVEEALQVWNHRASSWIPVSERLPDYEEVVLWKREYGDPVVGWRGTDKAEKKKPDAVFFTQNHYQSIKAFTHWMPIPPLPPAEKKEE